MVVPCYRCAHTLSRAYRSIAMQSAGPKEIVLVDDASGDETYAAMKQIACGDPRVRLIELTENQGPASARNAGWSAATQPLVAFLDADDAWHPRKLELQVRWMQAHPAVAMTSHRVGFYLPDDGCTPVAEDAVAAHPVSVWRQLRSNHFQTSTVVLRRDLTERFPAGKRYCEDLDLWLRIVLSGRQAWRLETVLGYTFKSMYGEGGLSAQLWKMERGELEAFACCRRLGLLSTSGWVGASAWSLAKFAVRCMNTRRRRAAPRPAAQQ